MAKPFKEFVDTYNGTAHDVDGFRGAQCWDGYTVYMKWLEYPYANCTATGGAKDIWTQRASNGMLNSCNVVSSPQMAILPCGVPTWVVEMATSLCITMANISAKTKVIVADQMVGHLIYWQSELSH